MLAPFHPQGGFALQTPQLPLRDRARLRRHQVPESIRWVIAPDAILIGIHLEHILGPIRIVLQ
jgi:hypothetical protein